MDEAPGFFDRSGRDIVPVHLSGAQIALQLRRDQVRAECTKLGTIKRQPETLHALFERPFASAPCGKQRSQSEGINRDRHNCSLGTFRTFEDRYERITKAANAEAGCADDSGRGKECSADHECRRAACR